MASQPNNAVTVIRQSLNQLAPELQAALPKHVTPEKFTRVAMTAIQNDPMLVDADRKSLFGSIVRLAQMGLLPDGREAALVIFNQKAKGGGYEKKVQAMPMIAGLLKMVRQSGELASIDSHVVYSNDKFTYRPGIDAVPIFEPEWFGDRGEPIGAYALATLKDGSQIPPEIMNREQIEKVRSVSKAGNSDYGPWSQWWSEMARKTVMRRLSKRLPMSTDLEDAFDRDETLTIDHQPALRVVENEEQAAPMSRLDAIEHQIEAEQEAEEVDAEIEPEGRADEEHGDQHDEEAPAWHAMVDDWHERIAKADVVGTIISIRAELKKHKDALPDDVVSALTIALDTKSAEFTTGGGK